MTAPQQSTAFTTVLPPHELAERAVEGSRRINPSGDCIAIAEAVSATNLRWANNTTTTNGVSSSSSITVIATDRRADGVATGVVTRNVTSAADVEEVAEAAVAAAKGAEPAEDASDLERDKADPTFTDDPVGTGIDVFADLAASLGSQFAAAAGAGRRLYGYAEHNVTTSYLASSTGMRLRQVQPSGYFSTTAKDGDGSNSAWTGQATRDFRDVDVDARVADLATRLAWGQVTRDLPAGRYETILPPAAVSDLLTYAYWTLGARDAHEGLTVFSKPGGGTRLGEQLTDTPFTVRSDPDAPGLECAPFVLTGRSSSVSSVFDNGTPSDAVTWIDQGRLTALATSRYTSRLTGVEHHPLVDNMLVEVDQASGDISNLIAATDSGLLLTCLWYIREVDPQTLLLTGLTRDGVYLVEGGEVVARVNNFRFNESPVDLLSRVSRASTSVPSFSREWGEYFPRTMTPAVVVDDFNFSSVSQAS
jgi:predicted Zn-dependent protease